jgi:hypothetical protein
MIKLGLLFSITTLCIPVFANEILIDGTYKKGSVYQTICNGSGPSIDLARSEAILNCKSSAAAILKSDIRISSLVINTETNSGLHEEIVENKSIKNLICIPGNEKIRGQAGFFEITLECRFDLSKVIILQNKVDEIKMNKTVNSQNKRIVVSTVPKCDSIVIVGKQSDILNCNSNPIVIYIPIGSQEIIIRAKNYKPKHLSIENLEKKDEKQIFLDPM